MGSSLSTETPEVPTPEEVPQQQTTSEVPQQQQEQQPVQQQALQPVQQQEQFQALQQQAPPMPMQQQGQPNPMQQFQRPMQFGGYPHQAQGVLPQQRISRRPTVPSFMSGSLRSPLQSGRSCDFKDDDPLEELASGPVQAGVAEPDPDASQEGPLTLSTRVEYSSLARGQTQTVFGLVTVQAAEAPPSDASAASSSENAGRQPMDIVCVLDVSGSMGQNNKIEDLKAAVRFIVDEAGPQDRLSLVAFESSADRKLKLRRMDRQGKDEATMETLRLRASGGTSIAAGLDMGLAVLEQRRQRNKVSAILLLTDGQDGSTRAHLPALTKRAAQAGCGLYAFGFGADHDAELLREISEQARTPYTYIETTATIREAFAGVVGGLSSIVAQRVEITLDCKVPLKQVNTPFEVRRDGECRAVVCIPDMFAGERRDVLLELAVPADLQGSGEEGRAVLLQASATYLDLRRGGGNRGGVAVRSAPVAMTVRRVDELEPELEPDEEVADQRERVEVTQALEQAALCSDEGRFGEAQQLIKERRASLASSVAKSRRTSLTMEALGQELEDAEHRMESSQAWRLGGAVVKDAFQMHKMQRCTNVTQSATTQVQKSSKAMYMQSTQTAWVAKSSKSPAASASSSSSP